MKRFSIAPERISAPGQDSRRSASKTGRVRASFAGYLMAIALAVLPARSGNAEQFSTTNLQFLYGGGFHDRFFGYNTPTGDMATLTLEHFSTWKYGDNFLFVDNVFGEMAGFDGKPTGDRTRSYGEWTPRLSLSRLSGGKLGFGPIKDVYLAGQFELGVSYRAFLGGLGFDLDVPGFNSLGFNVLRRDDNYNSPTFQATVFWSKPIRIRGHRLSLDGYVDIAGTDTQGIDISTQPQLLLDLAPYLHSPEGRVQLGLEWFFHRNRSQVTSVPQVVVKWKLH